MPNPTNLQRWATPFLVLLSLLALTCPAALTPSNVLVVYNAPASDPISDGKQITDHYLIKRPGALAVNLADETLAPGTISYANFKSKIRDSLRNYLTSNSLEQQIRVVVLTKDIPHRIQDINSGHPRCSTNSFERWKRYIRFRRQRTNPTLSGFRPRRKQ